MKFDYKIEVDNILNKIYEYKVCELIYKNNVDSVDNEKLNDYYNLLTNTRVYLGSDMYDFIIGLIPKDKYGYYFRCEIANYHNYSYPRLYDFKGDIIKNSNYSKYAIQIWESNMNDMLIEDVERKFNQTDFIEFINKNLSSMSDIINNYISLRKDNEKIVIEFSNKNELLEKVKTMILNNKMDLSFAHLLVDMDSLRSEMVKFSTPFHIYNEFDKLEDDTKYCLDNFCKYSSDELFDILIKDFNFEFVENLGLVKN